MINREDSLALICMGFSSHEIHYSKYTVYIYVWRDNKVVTAAAVVLLLKTEVVCWSWFLFGCCCSSWCVREEKGKEKLQRERERESQYESVGEDVPQAQGVCVCVSASLSLLPQWERWWSHTLTPLLSPWVSRHIDHFQPRRRRRSLSTEERFSGLEFRLGVYGRAAGDESRTGFCDSNEPRVVWCSTRK